GRPANDWMAPPDGSRAARRLRAFLPEGPQSAHLRLSFNEAFSAVASAACPLTRSAHAISCPIRRPFSVSLSPCAFRVSVYSLPETVSARLRSPSNRVMVASWGPVASCEARTRTRACARPVRSLARTARHLLPSGTHEQQLAVRAARHAVAGLRRLPDSRVR